MPGVLEIPPDRFVVIDGVRLHYLDWGGEGEPLLLLAGLGCTAHVFAELAPHLSDGFRVVALTRRGHGSSGQGREDFTFADGADDARRLLDALSIGRAHVAGHSMGGGEVSVLAARHPDRVGRLVYLDGAYDWADHSTPSTAEEAEESEWFASYEAYASSVYSLFADDLRGPAFEAMLRASVEARADGSVVDRHSEAAMAPFVRALEGFRHPYADIAAPVLALYALGGPQQAASRDRLVAERPDARVVELRASHYLFIDRRDDVVRSMREFLRDD